jgi:TonB-linked SusC/RagA family outer membrane protein
MNLKLLIRCNWNNCTDKPPFTRKEGYFIGKGRLAMKLLQLLILTLNISVLAESAAQISLMVKNAPLEKVMDEVKRQSGYDFVINISHLSYAKPVTASIHKQSLENTLKVVFKDQPLKFEIGDKVIYVTLSGDTEKKKIKPDAKNEGLPQRYVRGTVRDSTGNPLPFVSVRIQGTPIGTMTDQNGVFSLNEVPEHAILQFSRLGYGYKEIEANQDILIVYLTESQNEIAEVDVTINTGYQKIPKERATGSFVHIDNNLYNRQVSSDVISRLKAIAPSLLFDERTGQTKLNIRGQSTILANNQPLIVVDNFPYDGDLNSINPNDIESVSILRDAAASSIWGVRAGNGVIVITTKGGKIEEKMQIDLNSNLTIGNKPNLYYRKQMGIGDFVELEKFLFEKGKYDEQLNDHQTMSPYSPAVEILNRIRNSEISQQKGQLELEGLKQLDIRKDLEKYFYRNSISQQYSLALSGGGKIYGYYLSSGFDKIRSNKVANGSNRFTINSNNTFRPFSKLEIGVNVVYTNNSDISDYTLDNIRMGTINIYPYAALADKNGLGLAIPRDYRNGFTSNAINDGFLDWQFKPLDELSLSDNTRRSSSTRINTNARYNLFRNLYLDLRYQFDSGNYGNRTLDGIDSYYTRDLINSYSSRADNGSLVRNIPYGGILSLSEQKLRSHNGRAMMTYNNSWGKTHEVNLLAGFEAREIVTDGFGSKYYGYEESTGASANVDYTNSYILYPRGTGGIIPGPVPVSRTVDRFRSYFFNGAYTYLGKYTFSGSARKDESNLFGVKANQKGVPLWSIGLSWNMAKENFISDKIGKLNLRGSYGYSGNFDNTVTAFTTARYRGNYVFTQQPYAALETPPNQSLSWERIKMFNIGLDFATSSNRLTGNFDFYTKRGKDLLGYGTLNATTGFTTYKGNIAGNKGRGFDAQINSLNYDGNLKWYSTLWLSHQWDKVTSYEQEPNIGDLFIDNSSILGGLPVPVIGKPLFGIYSRRWAGLSAENGDPLGYIDGKPSNDYASILKQGIESDDIIFHGRATPSYFGAFRNTFTFKNIELSINLAYKFGYYFRRESINYGDLISYYTSHSDYALRWQKPGDESITHVPSFLYPNNSSRDAFYSRSEVLIEKGDHIRLEDVQVNYTFDNVAIKAMGLSNLNLYFYARNLGILWRANDKGIDPDYGRLLPAPFTYAFGIRANLK